MGRTLRTNGTLPRQPWGPHGCRGTAAGGDWIPLGPSLAGLPGACQTVDCAGVADDHASSRPRSGDCCRNGNDRPSHRPRVLPQRQRSPVAPPASVAGTATIARAGAPTPGPGPATVAVTATITRRPPASVAATATIAQPSAGSPPPPRRPRTRRRRRLVMPPADRRRPGGHARQTGCRAGCAVPRGDALQAASVEPPPACARSKPP